MTDAPERIWAWTSGIQPMEGAFGLWSQADKWKQERGKQYIRADLADADFASRSAYWTDSIMDALADRLGMQTSEDIHEVRTIIGRILNEGRGK